MSRHVAVPLVACAALLAACGAQPREPDSTRVEQRAAAAAAPAPAPAPAPRVAERHARAVAADSIALDSCAQLDHGARPQGRVLEPGETLKPPKPGSWSLVRVERAPRFTIEVPKAAGPMGAMAQPNGDTTWSVSGFPSCRYYCSLSVTFRPDSAGLGAEAYVARWRARQKAGGEEAAAWAPGPWRALLVDGAPGGLVSTECGDCSSQSVFAAHGDTIVEIQTSVDDRDGYQPGLLCRLARVAQSFQWAR